MKINEEMTIGDLIKSGNYGEFADYFFTDMTPDHYYCKLKDYGYQKVGFEYGLKRVEELAKSGKSYLHYIYEEEERMANWDKKKVCLLHFPGSSANKPYVLILPGGALNRQWGFVEGQTVAAKFNELGYTAFVLFYRTKQEPIMDKAIEDMYSAIRYISQNADQ